MKKYEAFATITRHYHCVFEVADDELSNPWLYAENLDSSEFKELDGCSEWKLYEVKPL